MDLSWQKIGMNFHTYIWHNSRLKQMQWEKWDSLETVV